MHPQNHHTHQPQQPQLPARGICAVIKGFLYIGSEADANDAQTLLQLRIGHLLCCASDITKPKWISTHPSPPTYTQLHLTDTSSDQLNDAVTTVAFAAIESARLQQSPILVFCKMGISRSASIVIAYLMDYQAHTFHSALKFLRTVRPQAEPNGTLSLQLVARNSKRRTVLSTDTNDDGTSPYSSPGSTALHMLRCVQDGARVTLFVSEDGTTNANVFSDGGESERSAFSGSPCHGVPSASGPRALNLLSQGMVFASVEDPSLPLLSTSNATGQSYDPMSNPSAQSQSLSFSASPGTHHQGHPRRRSLTRFRRNSNSGGNLLGAHGFSSSHGGQNDRGSVDPLHHHLGINLDGYTPCATPSANRLVTFTRGSSDEESAPSLPFSATIAGRSFEDESSLHNSQNALLAEGESLGGSQVQRGNAAEREEDDLPFDEDAFIQGSPDLSALPVLPAPQNRDRLQASINRQEGQLHQQRSNDEGSNDW